MENDHCEFFISYGERLLSWAIAFPRHFYSPSVSTRPTFAAAYTVNEFSETFSFMCVSNSGSLVQQTSTLATRLLAQSYYCKLIKKHSPSKDHAKAVIEWNRYAYLCIWLFRKDKTRYHRLTTKYFKFGRN